MVKDSPIPVKPMTLRGVFGITGTIVRRSFCSTVGYLFIYTLVIAALSTLCVLPVISGIAKDDGMRIAGGAVSTVLLVTLLCLFSWLVLYPIVNGTLYNEMSARMYGEGNSLGTLIKRSKFALKRFFTLNLCHSLGTWVVSMVSSLIMGVVSSLLMVGGMLGLIARLGVMDGMDVNIQSVEEFLALFGGLALPIALVCMISAVVAICATVPLVFIYPVAINENKKNFNALGRSISLGFRRFGRILGAQLLFSFVASLMVMVISGLFGGAVALAESMEGARAVFIVLAVIFAVGVVFLGAVVGAYGVALSTVLYFDAKAREDEAAAMQHNPVQGAPNGNNATCGGNAPYGNNTTYDSNTTYGGNTTCGSNTTYGGNTTRGGNAYAPQLPERQAAEEEPMFVPAEGAEQNMTDNQ